MYMLNFAVRTVPTSWETTAVLPPRSHVRTCTTQMKALTVLLEPNFATKLLHTEHLSDSANKNAKENDKSMPRSQHEMDRLYYEHRGAHRANELQTSNFKLQTTRSPTKVLAYKKKSFNRASKNGARRTNAHARNMHVTCG